jgi:hypothetical protein
MRVNIWLNLLYYINRFFNHNTTYHLQYSPFTKFPDIKPYILLKKDHTHTLKDKSWCENYTSKENSLDVFKDSPLQASLTVLRL